MRMFTRLMDPSARVRKKAPPKNHMKNLPKELLMNIAKRLNNKNFKSFSSTSKNIRSALKNNYNARARMKKLTNEINRIHMIGKRYAQIVNQMDPNHPFTKIYKSELNKRKKILNKLVFDPNSEYYKNRNQNVYYNLRNLPGTNAKLLVTVPMDPRRASRPLIRNIVVGSNGRLKINNRN